MMLEAVIISQLGAFITFHLAQRSRFDAIRASATVSIISYFICSGLSLDANLFSVICFGATFIGMSAPTRFSNISIIFAALIFVVFFVYLVPYLQGYGGALGLSSFLSICLTHVARLVILKFAKS